MGSHKRRIALMTLPDDAAVTGRPSAAAPPRNRWRRMARLAVVLVPPAALVAALACSAPPAAANPPGPHDPFGKVEKITANPDGSVHFVGWAADPDTTGNISLWGV